MGILDEAIREHLELKRQHGAADSELKELEDEAFGAAERPGSEATASAAVAEAPTEHMAVPEEASQRREPVDIGDLQEAPAPSEPVEEEQPAAEHETVEPAEKEEDRQAIAEQPTEHFDVEEELASGSRGPSDEELVEKEMEEPRLAPVDPLAGAELEEGGEVEVVETPAEPEPEVEAEADDEDDEFWNEQRLSDELDQALDAPLDEPEYEAEENAGEEREDESEDGEEVQAEEAPAAPRSDSDVLENTPDFLEDTPEDDELWFEQKPPKDFDFDD
jgi:hypothetical protein